MARTITAVSVFLASPSDVMHEREVVVSVVNEWNARHSRDESITFDLIRWETSVSAGFGDDGQDVINSQVGSDYDLLIAIFWSRFGSPTPRAASGTVEEYRRAFSRYQAGDAVEIAFLFKDVPVDFRTADLSQLSQLKDFEKEVQSAGALSKSFKNDDGLKLEVGIILDRLARQYSQRPKAASNGLPTLVKTGEASPSKRTAPLPDTLEEEEDLGLFDIVERLQQHAAAAGSFLDSFTSVLTSMSATTESVTAELESIRSVRPVELGETKPGIQRVADGMNAFSELLENEIPTFSENLNALGNDVRDIVRVSYDWIDTDENMLDPLLSFRAILSTIHHAIGYNQASLLEMLDSTAKMQRTTTLFNKAKRRLMHNANGLIDVNESGRAIIGLALDELGRLILAVEEHQPSA